MNDSAAQNGFLNRNPKAVDVPSDLRAEKSMLSSLLILPAGLEKLISEGIQARHFHLDCHQKIFRAMLWLWESGNRDFDPITVGDRLKQQGELPDIGGYDYLTELHTETEPHGAHVVYHAKIVRDKWIERQMAARASDLLRVIQDGTLSTAEKLEYASGLTAHLETDRPERFPMMTMAELAAGDFAGAYIIRGFLAALEFSIIVGPKKGLKTTLAFLMACSIALGRPLFGVFEIPQRLRVGFFSGESGPGTMQELERRMAIYLGRAPADIEELLISFNLPKLDSDSDMAEFERVIASAQLKVVFLDCFYRMLGGASDDVSNVFKMGSLLSRLMDVQQITGCTIVLLHHTKKHAPYEMPELDSAAFAGISEAARQWVLLGRREKYVPGSGHHPLWLSVGGSMGHSWETGIDIAEGNQSDPGGRHFDLELIPVSEARDAARDAGAEEREAGQSSKNELRAQADRLKILTGLADYLDGETRSVIRGEARLSAGRFSAALKELIDAGHVENCTITKNNTQQQAIRLTRNQSESVGIPSDPQ